jgi:hypothetical protein
VSRESARRAARRSTGSRIFRCAARPDRAKTQLCIDYFDRPLRAQGIPAHPGDEVSDALRGYDPGTIMTAAFNGINWWCEQAFLVQKLTTRQVASEGDAAAQGYKNKLLEVHSAYKRAKAKAEALWQQMQQLELDKKELQSKYEQKSGEKRRIEASFRELQSRAGAGAPAPTHALPRAHSHAVAMPPPSRHAYQQMASPPMHLGSPPVDRRPGTLQSRPSMANFGGGVRPLLSGFPAGGAVRRDADSGADQAHLALLRGPDEPAAGLATGRRARGRRTRVAQGRGRGDGPRWEPGRRAEGVEGWVQAPALAHALAPHFQHRKLRRTRRTETCTGDTHTHTSVR